MAKAKTYKANQHAETLDRDFSGEHRELEKEEGELKRLVEKQEIQQSKIQDTTTLKEKNSASVEVSFIHSLCLVCHSFRLSPSPPPPDPSSCLSLADPECPGTQDGVGDD